MSCKESIIIQQQWLKSTCSHVPSPDYNAVKANMAAWDTSTWINPKIHLWKEQNQFHQSRERRKLGFSSQGHTILPDDDHDLVMEGDLSYGAPSMTTGSLQEQGRILAASTLHKKPHSHHHHSPFQNICKAPVAVPCPSGPSVHTLLPPALV